jgi:mono/diheme cytochrome c family protein
VAASGLAAAIACTSGEASPEGRGKPARPKVSEATLSHGRTLYTTNCTPCHGDKGKGDGPASKIFKPPPRDHTDATYMNTITDEDMARTIQMGGAVKGKPLMPSHPAIRGDDMNALVAYVRSLSSPAR